MLEPEPSRKRSTSFRTGIPSPSGSQPQSLRCVSRVAGNTQQSLTRSFDYSPSAPSAPKMRSFSTTALPLGSSFCSLQRSKRSPKQSLVSQCTEELNEEEDEEVNVDRRPSESSATRAHLTSDYDISNESPYDCPDAAADTQSAASPSLPTSEATKGCLLCGKKRSRASFEGAHQAKAMWPNAHPPEPVAPRIDPLGRYVTKDGLAYDIEELAVDPLLNLISEWDFPIFELRDAAGDAILSEISYRIFLEAGLFDAFKIPLQVLPRSILCDEWR